MTKQEVIDQCTIDGNVIKLPIVQLDRKVYLDVKKTMEKIGGKWKGGKVAGFVFEKPPHELLDRVRGGENVNLKKEYQFFETPDLIAGKVVEMANIQPKDTVVEPSAGKGALLRHIQTDEINLFLYELEEGRAEYLEREFPNATVYNRDFLEANIECDKIIANPPFTKNQDIDHVKKMYECLRPGGRLVSVMSRSWIYGSHKKQEEFAFWLNAMGSMSEIVEIPPGAFKESGTNIPTVIVRIDKP